MTIDLRSMIEFRPRGAVLSDDGLYRYLLWRYVQKGVRGVCATCGELGTHRGGCIGRVVLFLMLNPSTADADTDDPTIRRCIGFARDLHYDRLLVANLFAYRATDPKRLVDPDVLPVGAECDAWIACAAAVSHTIVCAWGAQRVIDGRDLAVLMNLRAAGHGRKLRALGLTRAGHPRHPLYMPRKAPLLEMSHG